MLDLTLFLRAGVLLQYLLLDRPLEQVGDVRGSGTDPSFSMKRNNL